MNVFAFLILGFLSLDSYCSETLISNQCGKNYKIRDVSIKIQTEEVNSDTLAMYNELTNNYAVEFNKNDKNRNDYLALLKTTTINENFVRLHFDYAKFKELLHVDVNQIRKLQDAGGGDLLIPFIISITMSRGHDKVIHDIRFDKFFGSNIILSNYVENDTMLTHEYDERVSRVKIKISENSQLSSSVSSES